MVVFGSFGAEDCIVDSLRLLDKCQLNQEFGGGVWREGANCGVGSAAQHAPDEGWQVRDHASGVEGSGGFG